MTLSILKDKKVIIIIVIIIIIDLFTEGLPLNFMTMCECQCQQTRECLLKLLSVSAEPGQNLYLNFDLYALIYNITSRCVLTYEGALGQDITGDHIWLHP